MAESRQYVLRSDWGDVQPRAEDENRFLERLGWDDHHRAAEWRHKEIELAAHELLQLLDAKTGGRS